MGDLIVVKGEGGCSKYLKVTHEGTKDDPFELVVDSITNSVDVNIQDQTTPPIDFFFTQIKGTPTSVAVVTVFNEYEVTVVSATNCTIGDYVGIFNADNPTNNRAFFATILDIVGNVITLDTPIDFEFQVGNTFACFSRNINEADGSLTPEIFKVEVGSAATQSIDITRLMISILTTGIVRLDRFGDQVELIRGCVLRRVNGFTSTFFNVKTNGEIANLSFDYVPYLATNPNQGQNGAKFRLSFAGQDKHGVAIRLNPGDSLELVVQDDLTDLEQFRIIAEGHYVD